MLRSAYITRILSGLLLVVFAFSITPKRFLHDIFAKHIDKRPVNITSKPYQLVSAGYNCDNDNLVVESSFVSDQQIISYPVFTSFSSYTLSIVSFSSAVGIYSLLRGPPVNI